jgi:hypothetical protein
MLSILIIIIIIEAYAIDLYPLFFIIEAYAIDSYPLLKLPYCCFFLNLVLMLQGSFILEDLNITIQTSTLDYNGERYLSSIIN